MAALSRSSRLRWRALPAPPQRSARAGASRRRRTNRQTPCWARANKFSSPTRSNRWLSRRCCVWTPRRLARSKAPACRRWIGIAPSSSGRGCLCLRGATSGKSWTWWSGPPGSCRHRAPACCWRAPRNGRALSCNPFSWTGFAPGCIAPRGISDRS